MTSRTRLLALTMVALMTASVVMVVSPAVSAQETVPTEPEVRFQDIPSIRQDFHLRFATQGQNNQNAGGTTPNCAAPFLSFDPAEPGAFQTRASCSYTTTDGCATPALCNTVTFEAPSSLFPKRRISFTGNDSFIYHHQGMVPEGVTLTVEVFTGTTSVARGAFTVPENGAFPGSLRLELTNIGATTGRAEFIDNQTFKVQLTGTTPDDEGGTLPVPVGSSWTISDVGPEGSFLELRSDNAIRAALWITDEADNLRNVFAPIANESQIPADANRRVVGHFALASAFGYEDASRGAAPTFTIHYAGRPREVGPGGQTTLVPNGVNVSASVQSLGVAVWSFPTGAVNYRGFAAGEYTVFVDKTHHQGGSIGRSVEKTFAITAQSVSLFPFSDPRAPGLVETQSHSVQPGGSTTYILAVNNTGSVNDTFTVNLSTANAPPGWGAVVGGPDVQSRRILVPAGETRVFTVTVNAPGGATGEIIHLVNVTSSVDPSTRSRDLTLVTRVSNEVIREVGIIFLPRDLAVEPGVQTLFPVYVWNRGTRTQNVSLEIQENPLGGWVADLAQGSNDVDRIVLGAVQPGDISEATLKITGPANAATQRHDLTLNASSQDAAGVTADRLISFTLRTVAGVTVQVMNEIGSRTHVAELSGERVVANPVTGETSDNPACGQPEPLGIDCTDDGVDGVWFRVWVTNTGRVSDSFILSGESFRKASNSECSSAWIPGTGADAMAGEDEFDFYVRDGNGAKQQRASVESLLPGRTAEFYVWLPVNRNQDPCPHEPSGDFQGQDFYSFVVQARGQNTGALGRGIATAIARNDDRPHTGGVYIEGVVRENGYNPQAPLVDVQNQTKREIVGLIEPGKNTTFYVRMTNTAKWSTYNDEDGVRRAPDMHVFLEGVDYEGGWNVSIRPVKVGTSNTLEANPYRAQYNLTNENTAVSPTKREAWIDQELEVVVQAPTPENGTVGAGRSHVFFISSESANGTGGDKSTLKITTIVGELANVTLRPDQERVFAHPGDPGAFLLYVSNNGSSEAERVTLRAAMSAETPNGAQWQISPNAQEFPLPAFKNRTVALLVTPPAGAPQGTTGTVNVTLEYARSPSFATQTVNVTRLLTVEVVAPGTLSLAANTSATTVGPGNTANFTMQLRNSGTLQVPFDLSATPIPNWTVTVSPESGVLNAGETRTVVLVMIAPRDVVNDSRFATIVRVVEDGASNNFDTQAFTVNILGGQALPRVSVPNLLKRVDRSGVQNFEVQVQNVGTANGRLPLEVRSQDPSWLVGITDARGNAINGVDLGVNQLVNINVTVRAPFTVPERTVVPVEIIAYSPDQSQAAKATLSAEVHDYGVQVTLVPSNKDGLPGVPTEFVAKVRNTGNDNDTLNLSVNLVDLPEWSVQLSSQEIRLEPNQELDVFATIRGPTDPLPTARAYTFPFWIGTRGGQAVNISKNMSVSAVVTLPNYRAYDVDRDGQLEITVDLDKRANNGFEEFREPFAEGSATQVIAKPLFEGRTTFFLDVPRDRPYDGVADVWFNPETVHAFDIVHAPDINGDGTPDYLLDTDRDGEIDRAFDTATERFWTVIEVKVFDDDRIQYLIDTTGDGRPDRFFDPEGDEGRGLVTRTQSADSLGADYVGIDVDDDERVDYYYNTRTEETSGAEVQNFGGFAVRYWYFFLVFAALVLVTVMLIVRRRRAPPAP